MATKIYLRRGTLAEIEVIVPESGEPVWATDTKGLYVGDDTTSGGIFVGGSGIGVDTLNALFGDITISGGAGIVITISGQTILVSEQAGGLDVDSLNALTGDVVIQGAGLITVTEDGQNIVVSGEDPTDVSSLNALVDDVTIQGAGLITVTEDGQKIVVSGEDPIDIDSLNGLTGDVTISGVGGTVVSVDGQIITVSGGAGGETTFLGLTDTPDSYANQARKVVAVNEAEDALEFVQAIGLNVALADHDYSGLVSSGIANETLVFGDSVILLSGETWGKTNCVSEDLTDGHVAMVVTSGNDDENIVLLLVGYARDDSWSWNIGDGGLYISSVSGALTQTPPTASGEFVRIVAQPRSSNVVWYNPDNTVIELE